jgi:hypothetical protein
MPRPESTAPRAEHFVGEEKVRFFFLEHLSQGAYKIEATAKSWSGTCWRMC